MGFFFLPATVASSADIRTITYLRWRATGETFLSRCLLVIPVRTLSLIAATHQPFSPIVDAHDESGELKAKGGQIIELGRIAEGCSSKPANRTPHKFKAQSRT